MVIEPDVVKRKYFLREIAFGDVLDSLDSGSNSKTLYGQGAVDLIDSYNKLNELGQKKAVEAVADLADIDRYRK